MTDSKPTTMEPQKAAEALKSKLDPRTAVTVADAAAKSGLALRDAERGLQALTSEFRGQLRVTDDGALVYRFPTGFTKPWETRDAVDRVFASVGHALIGVLRFVVRAWIMIVLVGYAALFVALIIAMTFAQQGENRNSRRAPGGDIAFLFFRILGDAFFWTWRPFSPMYLDSGYSYGSYGSYGYGQPRMRARVNDGPKVPFYERVNRFFFGPTEKPEDPRENERRIVAAIRSGKGRIGLGDVMRVTGLARGVADSMMARLMLDYDGDVDVSEDGGIVYRFPSLRKTAAEGASEPEPPPVWSRAKPELPPFTGNTAESNFAIVALNAFNLLMSGWVMANGLTIERLVSLFSRVPHTPIAPPGTAWALGIVPFVFSLLLFLIPIARAVTRPLRAAKLARERGRLAVLREVLERTRTKRPIPDAALAGAYEKAAGVRVSSEALTRELTALGGDVDLDDKSANGARWRFVDLETEAAALEAERAHAPEDEARLGKVVFATDDN